jgi:hypothetical protein
MTRAVIKLILLIGGWWSLLLLPWVSVAGESLIGADLNQTMALLPAVSALSLIIALYRKLPRLLFVVSSLALLSSSLLALVGGLGASPAVIEARERISGIAGGGEIAAALSPTATVFGVVGLALAVFSMALLFQREKQSTSTTEESATDNRDLWDEQSE